MYNSSQKTHCHINTWTSKTSILQQSSDAHVFVVPCHSSYKQHPDWLRQVPSRAASHPLTNSSQALYTIQHVYGFSCPLVRHWPFSFSKVWPLGAAPSSFGFTWHSTTFTSILAGGRWSWQGWGGWFELYSYLDFRVCLPHNCFLRRI